MNYNSISFKLMFFSLLLVSVISLCFGTFNYFSTRAALVDEQKSNIQLLVARAQLSLPGAIWNFQQEQLQLIVKSEAKSEIVDGLYVMDENQGLLFGLQKVDGELLAAEQPPTGDALVNAPLVFVEDEEENKVGHLAVLPNKSRIQGLLMELLLVTIVQTLLLDVAVVGGIFLLLRKLVVGPLGLVSHAMKDVAEGEGDLTKRIEVHRQDEIGELAGYFNRFIDAIHVTVSRLAESVVSLTNVSQELANMAELQAEQINKQHMATEQVATAITEMAAASRDVATSASDAAASARQVEDQGNTATRVLNGAVDSVNGLSQEIGEASTVINNLEQDVTSIVTVLEVIRGIAEQTNLLALNAAIEAARAGEQGRGFAVVADEVRNLANRTQESTTEIQSMIERLRDGSNQAVQAMHSSRDKSEQTREQSSNATESLTAMKGAIGTINEMNSQIATAVEEQSVVSEDISMNVNSISEVASEVSEMNSTLTSTSQDLAILGEKINDEVRRFKI